MAREMGYEVRPSEDRRRPPGESPRAEGPDLQILSTEHWSLLATRSLSWNESFARTQMFLSVLSGAVVALALVAQATEFGPAFVAFALVTLPIVLFVGVTTFIRLVAINAQEGRWLIGMNRIRGAYLEMAPHLERYFVTGHHDDFKGVMLTGGWGDSPTVLGFVTTPSVVAVICSVLAAVIAFLALDELQPSSVVAAIVAALAFLVAIVAFLRYQSSGWTRTGAAHRPINPTPER